MNHSTKLSVIFAFVIMLVDCTTEKHSSEKRSPVIGLDIPDFWRSHKDQLKLLAKEIGSHGESEDVVKKALNLGCEKVFVFPEKIVFLINGVGWGISGYAQKICYKRPNSSVLPWPAVNSIDDAIRSGNKNIVLSQKLEDDWTYELVR